MKIKKHSELMMEVLKEELQNQVEPLKPKVLKQEIESMLNQRLEDEYKAHYFYLNASNWCNGVGFTNAGSFFAKESTSELEHALKIQDYMVGWNLIPKIPQVQTNFDIDNLIQIINQAYNLEYDLLIKYSNDSKQCLIKDMSTFTFLQSYVQIQTQSVKEFSDLLNVLELIDYNDKYQLLYFENKYFGG
jgi:ferritin